MSLALLVAISIVRVWTRMITGGLPPGHRESRIAEIESDLWESLQDRRERDPFTALQILQRLVAGIPDDLHWRLEQGALAGDATQESVTFIARLSGAAMFVGLLWMIQVDVQRPLRAVPPPSPVGSYDSRLAAGVAPGSLVAGVMGTVGSWMAPAVSAQAPSRDTSFDVASVKPNKTPGPFNQSFSAGGRFTASRMPLRDIIRTAYRIQDFQLKGNSGLLDEHFDILAKTDGNPTVVDMQAMLRTLLADRFALKSHMETQQLPVYSLALARTDGKLGADLRPTGAECAPIKTPANGPPPPPPPPPGVTPPPGPGRVDDDPNRLGQGCPGMLSPGMVSARKMTMRQLANLLGRFVGRMVVDQTGLDGNFDIDLQYMPDQGGPDWIPADSPSLFTAVQEQLGLKLESTRGPVDVLVIDSVQMPTPD